MPPSHLISDLSPELFLRIGLTFLASLVLGIERERHGRAAGLRTIIIVSLASCMAMLISDIYYRESFRNPEATWHPDPARLAAGVLAGMGFLGAGVIIHHRHSHITRGVTTAALLWFASMVGMAFGSGAIGLGLVATGLSSVVLFLLPQLEHLIPNDWYSDLSIRCARETTLEEIITVIEAQKVKIKGFSWNEQVDSEERSLRFHLKFKSTRLRTLPEALMKHLGALPGVKGIHWHG